MRTADSCDSSQLPHAVGAAYSLKMDKRDACVVAYFGDGGSSEVTSYLVLSECISLVMGGSTRGNTFIELSKMR